MYATCVERIRSYRGHQSLVRSSDVRYTVQSATSRSSHVSSVFRKVYHTFVQFRTNMLQHLTLWNSARPNSSRASCFHNPDTKTTVQPKTTVLQFETVPTQVRQLFYTFATEAQTCKNNSALGNSAHSNSSTVLYFGNQGPKLQ